MSAGTSLRFNSGERIACACLLRRCGEANIAERHSDVTRLVSPPGRYFLFALAQTVAVLVESEAT